jgi:hypothetical protein
MDIRVPMVPIERAFGLSISVKFPGLVAIPSRGVWMRSLSEEPAVGREYTRRDPRRVMALLSDELPEIQLGTLIVAPEIEGETAKNWKVDGVEKTEPDEVRVVLVPEHV